MSDPKDELVEMVYDKESPTYITLTKNKLFNDTIVARLRFIENEIENFTDIEYALSVLPSHLRWVADCLHMLKRWAKQETISLEVLYGQLEIEIRSDQTKKYTINEVKALIYNDNPDYVERLQDLTAVQDMIDHLESLFRVLLVRKEVTIERSTNERTERKNDRDAL